MPALPRLAAFAMLALPLAACDTGQRVARTGTDGQYLSSWYIGDFMGARVNPQAIEASGYRKVRTEGEVTWWTRTATGECARVISRNGYYGTITMHPVENCA